MPLHESGEDYLEAILVLHEQKGNVRSIDVAQHLGYSKPSVSRAMSILRSSGYITMERDGRILLTEAGKTAAESVYERHRFLTKWLIQLGVTPEVAAEDACRIEHDISPETFACLKRHLDGPDLGDGGEKSPMPDVAGGDCLDPEEHAIFTVIAAIPGVDATQAVSRMMGRRDLYVRLARRLVDERSDLVGRLDAARQAGDRDGVRELVHGAKSLLGMLGADDLQRRCVELQRQFAEDGVEEGEIARFAADLAAMLARLAEAVRPDQAQPDDRPR